MSSSSATVSQEHDINDYRLLPQTSREEIVASCQRCIFKVFLPQEGKIPFLSDLIDRLSEIRESLAREDIGELRSPSHDDATSPPSPSSSHDPTTLLNERPRKIRRLVSPPASSLRRPGNSRPTFSDLSPRIVTEHILTHIVVKILLPSSPTFGPDSTPALSQYSFFYGALRNLFFSYRPITNPLILFGRFVRDPFRTAWFVFRSILFEPSGRGGSRLLQVPESELGDLIEETICVVPRQVHYVSIVTFVEDYSKRLGSLNGFDNLPPMKWTSMTMLEKLCLTNGQIRALQKLGMARLYENVHNLAVAVMFGGKERIGMRISFHGRILSVTFCPRAERTFETSSVCFESLQNVVSLRVSVDFVSVRNSSHDKLTNQRIRGVFGHGSGPLAVLPKMPSLQRLVIRDVVISDNILAGIGSCSLRSLVLINVAGLTRLPSSVNLTDLRRLHLSSVRRFTSNLTDVSFKFVAFHPGLERLVFQNQPGMLRDQRWLQGVLESGRLRYLTLRSWHRRFSFDNAVLTNVGDMTLENFRLSVQSKGNLPQGLETAYFGPNSAVEVDSGESASVAAIRILLLSNESAFPFPEMSIEWNSVTKLYLRGLSTLDNYSFLLESTFPKLDFLSIRRELLFSFLPHISFSWWIQRKKKRFQGLYSLLREIVNKILDCFIPFEEEETPARMNLETLRIFRGESPFEINEIAFDECSDDFIRELDEET